MPFGRWEPQFNTGLEFDRIVTMELHWPRVSVTFLGILAILTFGIAHLLHETFTLE